MRLYTKLAVVAAAVALLSGSFVLGTKHEAGRAAIERDVLLEREKDRLQEIWAGERARAAERHERELRAAQAHAEVRREIPAVATPECVALGADWLGLHNRAVDAANRASIPE